MPSRNPPSSAAKPSPDFSAGSSAPPPPPRRRRTWLRVLVWLLLGLLALVLAVAGAVWWWAGSSTSLALALARAAQYLPAEQKLESRDVTGSLRTGGSIGWLRWSSPGMVVEVDGARIGWQLAPLLSRKVELGEVHASRVRITPQATAPSTEPVKPLTQLVLPVQVAVPFQVDSLEWAGSPEQQISLAGEPAVQAQRLVGDYRYDGTEHHLKIDNVELAQGRYSAQVKLQALAPMAIDATLDGTVQTTPPGGGNPLRVAAHATVQGTLATAAAQLQAAAQLKPVVAAAAAPAASAPAASAAAPPARKGTSASAKASAPAHATAPAEPMQADVQATILPWVPQPLKQAQATLKALDLAALWPQAPRTLLHGTVKVDPVDASAATAAPAAPTTPATPSSPPAPSAIAGWNIAADLRNDLPGPWDTRHLPLAALQARAGFDGTRWDVPEANATIGTGKAAGTIALKGQFTPATGAAEGQADLRNLRPDALHTALAAAPLGGRITAQGQADQAVRFTADIRATGNAPAQPAASTAPAKGRKATAPLLRINTFTAQGQYLAQVGGGTVQLDKLLLDALQAKVEATQLRVAVGEQSAQGQLKATVPGATVNANGQIAPAKGAGELQVQLADAERTQAWLASLPGMADAAKGITAKGQAQLNARWTGGWQTAQRQIEAVMAGKALPPAGAAGKDAFTLQARLNTPQLDVALPPGQGGAGAMSNIQLRSVNAELAGSLAQATLALDGEARTGTQRASVRTRLAGGTNAANEWQAQVTELRLQAQDTQLPGPWAVQLAEPVTVKLRMGAATPAPAAPAASGTAPSNTSAALSVQASAGQARITGPVAGTVTLRWQPVSYAGGGGGPLRLQTQGSLQGLPMAWVDAFGGTADAATGKPAQQPLLARLGLAGNIVFDGQWNVDTTSGPLRASASVRRASGDLRILAVDQATITTVQSSGQGAGAGSPTATVTEEPGSSSAAGVRQAELSVEAEGDALRARLVWASARAGEVDATASTRLTLASTLAATTLAPDAPLAGTLRARLPDVGVWSALAPPGWRVRGTLDANATLSGTRAAPRWAGTLGADELAVRSILDGVDLQGGRLRAALNGNQLDITEFRLRGGTGSKARIPGYSGNRTSAPQDGGTLSGTGRVSWAAAGSDNKASGIAMNFEAEAKALQVLARADRQVSVSGKVQAQLQQGQFSVRGKLTTDRATIILPDESAPSLGSDVVVRSAAKDREAQAKAQAIAKANQAAEQPAGASTAPTTAKPPEIAITLNLGNDFALQGHGITTRLTGELDVRSSPVPGAPPRVIGEVRTDQGRYRAWGQMLDVETGLIRFSGPYNNPSLDILALRPNISVRAGVQVSGSVLAPRVRLYSDPDLPDAEKLSWVVLGRDAAAGGAEAAVLQQAALALLGRKGGGAGPTANMASRLGLDEIGFKGPGAGEDATGAALTFGKRLSTDLYVTYERSLSGTLGTLYIFYDLSRRLTLRGQTGAQSAVDIIYTLKYD